MAVTTIVTIIVISLGLALLTGAAWLLVALHRYDPFDFLDRLGDLADAVQPWDPPSEVDLPRRAVSRADERHGWPAKTPPRRMSLHRVPVGDSDAEYGNPCAAAISPQ